MNNKNEMIALELTKIYVEKCLGIAEERIIEIYKSYLDILNKKANEDNFLEKVQKELGECKLIVNKIKRKLEETNNQNFIYKTDVEEILGGQND